MKLSDLLTDLVSIKHDAEVTHIALDSREISDGGVFFAVAGARQHGLLYAAQVQQQGAVAIIYDPAKQGAELAKNLSGILLIAVENLTEKLGLVAARFYEQPAQYIDVIGITGTNGKTSCSQFLAQAMKSCGVIGTLGWGKYTDLHSTSNTTPDAFTMHKILAQFVRQNLTHVAMEVSSHGLEQGRVNAIKFNGVIFNNLSRDHLDYHGSMEAYFQAKLRLVQWPGLRFVVVNLDDAYAERVIANISDEVRVLTYSLQDKMYAQESSIKASNIKYTLAGIECDVHWQKEQARLKAGLLGDFNLQNILAVLAVLLEKGCPLNKCLTSIQSIKPVIGRMECFTGAAGKPLVVVDYAHTPDALGKVLSTLRQHCQLKLSVVFGCGGDRDKGKRKEMGAIAERLADQVIVTDDNPRFEDGSAIINDVITGLKMQKVRVINDRKSAIKQGIVTSSELDIVLIAGKGHEDYQEIKGVKQPFSDREIVQELLAA
ncbi:UDP-N-acetylmuramoyl-L-alanyl-D-glutamate--2,6-diaminopimelate ligase [Bathymodiolus platifrons methanotrophic gill symbiont]|uniref:UDP-N-acetylmuramoyl-L-alanyl-D-glutamate--2, 6-diaminopimelate ligase n=1 Tax=Bathymodiolus platifrons methanotrophic gill symbiont TaxID=113268 RepID=UPI000B409FDD|nr:UDP-N-acetylmuramoyl-L-alanyl-D-glutamate--2,6-diaminopimelate ligase [Bathymodiolus platifrons methanotrophic gill symbiont]MCK5869936.1 UDP-N-acetylmuramoyl-L-alanyl-D-glutamate--2,6-diaminopimelate ligase [Methyloprofundus sp.]TXK96151.1 UDP-N-acetylmuramoyl-L-alanyl-D-glutamate--2,6-diaminopimelate ligase [Methylococcaceae bacterium CS4]TXK97767.1 UDP-N-acetylmuramoyl-L-alanyl-D-glutamate--2,6-diaminopimelate ligase [Methylococcaceae bacterium CS5]TXL05793.1 UDP-N-acetylmuramoyl-L-alanyl